MPVSQRFSLKTKHVLNVLKSAKPTVYNVSFTLGSSLDGTTTLTIE